jgi:hypothetical protein
MSVSPLSSTYFVYGTSTVAAVQAWLRDSGVYRRTCYVDATESGEMRVAESSCAIIDLAQHSELSTRIW